MVSLSCVEFGDDVFNFYTSMRISDSNHEEEGGFLFVTPRSMKFFTVSFSFRKNLFQQEMRRCLLQKGYQHTKRQFNTLSSVDHFAQHFKSTFPKEKKRPIRAVGREAEYPVRIVYSESTLTSLYYILRNA